MKIAAALHLIEGVSFSCECGSKQSSLRDGEVRVDLSQAHRQGRRRPRETGLKTETGKTVTDYARQWVQSHSDKHVAATNI